MQFKFNQIFTNLISLLCYLLTVSLAAYTQSLPTIIESPSGIVKVTVALNEQGEPTYAVSFKGNQALGASKMGFLLKNGALRHFSFIGMEMSTTDETWTPVWGEVAQIRNHFQQATIRLGERDSKRPMNIVFRVFNDGVGFRYEFPSQNGSQTELVITDELTEFQLMEDLTTFWIPGDWDSQEYRYATTKLSEIDGVEYAKEEQNILTKTSFDRYAVQTPITFRGLKYHLTIHEAALVDFPAMHLVADVKNLKFTALLTPSADSTVCAVVKTQAKTPWRTILVAPNAAGLIESKLILNLNEPSKLEDVSWIKPMKYVGIWWELHIGKTTWDYYGRDGKPHGRHGATTKNTKRYIDFAAANRLDGVLVEGWNIGWENWFGQWMDSVFSFTTPYPDYDIEEVSRYAREKEVSIIGHHETSSAVTNYESQIDAAYVFCNKYGIRAIKTGYVGRIVPRGEFHDGQWMVNHYVRVAEKTAQYQIMLNAHEPVRPTGLHRTYPHWLACEAARGNEFNAWSRGNLPEHETILPFTRLLGGPMDYTPGIFDITLHKYRDRVQVHTTVAKQLALYVTLYSPLQMAADLPENYENKPEFQFIRDVAVDWSDTKILNAEIGDYLTIVRKAKGTENWFIGSITDENPRTFKFKLDFLTQGTPYTATIYEDGTLAHYEKNPFPVNIRKQRVKKGDTLELRLAAGGGAAVSIMAVK
jgi:hypothetical protein